MEMDPQISQRSAAGSFFVGGKLRPLRIRGAGALFHINHKIA